MPGLWRIYRQIQQSKSFSASAIFVLLCALLATALYFLIRWAIIDAVWSGESKSCHSQAGACWIFIAEKWRFILFGLYPPSEQWRPTVALLMLSGFFWLIRQPGRTKYPAGLLILLLDVWLSAGGGLLPSIPVALWGGLPLTLLLTLGALLGALPLAIALAFARTSRIYVLRAFAMCYIETLRAVPLISVLFMASVMLPLLMPETSAPDKMLRALGALILFVAAYMAEAIRGGLVAIAAGQREAAAALGFGRRSYAWLIALPQAMRTAIPALTGIAIGTFKDTSLVLVIGLLDLMTTTRAALSDPQWLGHPLEAYGFAMVLYGVMAWGASQTARHLETTLTHHM